MASWARIDNREELAHKLDISGSEAERILDSELILKCYLKWSEDCVDHLIGDFVFVVYDGKKRKIFCGRDHMGVRPFYYYLSDERFFCATGLSALIHLKELPIQIRTQWMADYLTHLSMSFDGTPYENIHKLQPAHTLIVTPENHHLRQYFELSSEPALKLKDSREYVDAYREQLETAVKCRLNTTYPLGSELSGGIDSSTITAYGARFFEQPLTNFHTFAFANSELEPQHREDIMKMNEETDKTRSPRTIKDSKEDARDEWHAPICRRLLTDHTGGKPQPAPSEVETYIGPS